jgi:hypothetical protein
VDRAACKYIKNWCVHTTNPDRKHPLHLSCSCLHACKHGPSLIFNGRTLARDHGHVEYRGIEPLCCWGTVMELDARGRWSEKRVASMGRTRTLVSTRSKKAASEPTGFFHGRAKGFTWKYMHSLPKRVVPCPCNELGPKKRVDT